MANGVTTTEEPGSPIPEPSEVRFAEQVSEKIEEYFRSGVRQVWVVYPGTSKVYLYDSSTSVRILQVGDDLDGGSMLPGFRLALEDLFQQGTED